MGKVARLCVEGCRSVVECVEMMIRSKVVQCES